MHAENAKFETIAEQALAQSRTLVGAKDFDEKDLVICIGRLALIYNVAFQATHPVTDQNINYERFGLCSRLINADMTLTITQSASPSVDSETIEKLMGELQALLRPEELLPLPKSAEELAERWGGEEAGHPIYTRSAYYGKLSLLSYWDWVFNQLLSGQR